MDPSTNRQPENRMPPASYLVLTVVRGIKTVLQVFSRQKSNDIWSRFGNRKLSCYRTSEKGEAEQNRLRTLGIASSVVCNTTM